MRVVLLWHMHQPDYRVDGRFSRPWVYLHALAGYTEMASRLEASPAMRAVVNFTPVLIDQLDDYAARLSAWKRDGRPIGDPILDALVELPAAGAGREAVARACLPEAGSARPRRYPRYAALVEAAMRHDLAALPDDIFANLLVWFHLAWLGHAQRAREPRVLRLIGQGTGFDLDARRSLLELMAETLVRVLPRWRALGAEQRVELATSPYYHPLSPLMIDFESALDRVRSATIPADPYPGGRERLAWHLDQGRARFQAAFGQAPEGCWPPEGAVSDAALRSFAQSGFGWTASSRAVLEATFVHHDTSPREPYALFRHQETGIHCAFRDDGLSDRIGFEYQHWQPADAVRDLVQHLEAIAREPHRDLVLIALDGENPWEFYRDEGSEFLSSLFDALASHDRLRSATMQDCVHELAGEAVPLPPLRAGSWVHGELTTWIGHHEKNRAWKWLIEAKRVYDAGAGGADPALAHRLGACEGSDWFWWPGVYNPSQSVAQFDELYRAHLAALYRSLGAVPPEALARPFASGVTHEVAAGGTMLRGA